MTRSIFASAATAGFWPAAAAAADGVSVEVAQETTSEAASNEAAALGNIERKKEFSGTSITQRQQR
jgi:hypothetical protein